MYALIAYAGLVLGVLLATLVAYYFVYSSMVQSYKEIAIQIAQQYNNATLLYAQLYLQYLYLLKEYLNVTSQMGIVPQNLPSPPPISLPNMPISVSVALPNQIAIPSINSWPPYPPS